MGKFRHTRTSEKEQARETQKETNKKISGWVRKILDKGTEWADEQHEKTVMQAEASRYMDFMEICGVSDPADIDWDNPHVKIVKLTCDPVNIRFLANPKQRYRVYEKMDPET